MQQLKESEWKENGEKFGVKKILCADKKVFRAHFKTFRAKKNILCADKKVFRARFKTFRAEKNVLCAEKKVFRAHFKTFRAEKNILCADIKIKTAVKNVFIAVLEVCGFIKLYLPYIPFP